MTAFGDKDICRLNVAVDDAFRVGGIECVGGLDRDGQQTLRRHGAASDHVLEGHSLQVFHRDKASAIVLTDFVDGADIRMVERRSRTSLAAETLQSLGVLRDIVRKKLQRDETT